MEDYIWGKIHWWPKGKLKKTALPTYKTPVRPHEHPRTHPSLLHTFLQPSLPRHGLQVWRAQSSSPVSPQWVKTHSKEHLGEKGKSLEMVFERVGFQSQRKKGGLFSSCICSIKVKSFVPFLFLFYNNFKEHFQWHWVDTFWKTTKRLDIEINKLSLSWLDYWAPVLRWTR